MAISPVTAGGLPQANPFSQFRQAFGQLTNALQSGNQTAAQTAYNTLSSSPLAQNGPFAAALSQIGQDLQSGKLADAQKTLAALQQQLQQAHHGHRHHHGIKPPDASNSADQSQSTGANQSNASDPDRDGDSDGSGAGAATASDSDHRLDVTA
jgi:hypothetical protein